MFNNNIYQDSIGIHTFMLTAKLTYTKYRELKLILQKSVLEKSEYYLKSKFFSDIGYYGLTAKLYMQNEFARLEIIVNPTNLLNKQYMQTEIFTEKSNCKKVIKKINEALIYINMEVSMFIISRIDLCVNFITSPEIVNAYIKLGQKSYIHSGINRIIFADDDSNQHSLTLKCNTFEVEIYDKEFEVAKRNKQLSDTFSFGTILRMEVRLKRTSIYMHTSNMKLHQVLKEYLDTAQSIMISHFERCFRKGDYYTLNDARTIVRCSSYSNKSQERMIQILESRTTIEGSLNQLSETTGLLEKSIVRIKHKFEKIGLSMSTLPVRLSEITGPCLPGIIKLLQPKP